jgi:hypothetical protein
MSEPVGIDCGDTCAAVFNANVQVILTPSADDPFVFSHWEGCDVGGDHGAEGCAVTMDQDKEVTAFFE